MSTVIIISLLSCLLDYSRGRNVGYSKSLMTESC